MIEFTHTQLRPCRHDNVLRLLHPCKTCIDSAMKKARRRFVHAYLHNPIRCDTHQSPAPSQQLARCCHATWFHVCIQHVMLRALVSLQERQALQVT